MAKAAYESIDSSGSYLCGRSCCVIGPARDDINHAVHRICAPHGPCWSTDYLYSFDTVQVRIDGFPTDTASAGHIDRAPIDQHQNFIAVLAVEPTTGNRISRRAIRAT